MKSIEEILKSLNLPVQDSKQRIKERVLKAETTLVPNKKRKKGAPESGIVVFQHNNLVEANYKLSLQEKRIILWLISQIEPSDEDFKEHMLEIEKFIKIAGLSGESSYKEIKKITHKLIRNLLTIHKLDKQEEVQVAWLCSARYMNNEGQVALSFSPEMKPFLLELKSQFTAIKLSDLMQFSSIYAIRIYELLKQYENIGERTIEIQVLRKRLGIEKKLLQHTNFKKRVILISQREINAKSDIEFDFEEIKTGKRITKLKFKISKNKKGQKQPVSALQDIKRRPPVYYLLDEFGLTKRMINKIIKENKENDIINAINAVEIQMKKGNVKNPKAMVQAAIKEKWHPEIFKVKK